MRDIQVRTGPPGAHPPNSFTLVEVVIAIAVIAFSLISILGLMTYTSQVLQQSDTYSRLSDVVGQVVAQYDSQPFSVSTNCALTNATYYYTYEGLPTNNSTAAFYQANVTNGNPSGWALTNVMQIQLSIRWPKPQFVNTNVIIISTFNYD
jgi:uncharacterized protein (TIGR02598 family)